MPDGTPVISDFTLTTFQNKGKEVAFGTLFWRSPECIVQKQCTIESDVWSFGMILLDFLYGCIYCQDILEAKTDKILFQKIIQMFGQPSLEWIHKFAPDKTDWTIFTTENTIDQDFLVDGDINTKKHIIDLIVNILVWEPTKRLTMTEIINHPFFTILNTIEPKQTTSLYMQKSSFRSKLINTKISNNLNNIHWNIVWRNDNEKKYLFNLIIQWASNHEYKIQDWLVNDIIIICKKVTDKLRHTNVKFQFESIVEWVSTFYYFIWNNKWCYDPFFESAIFHILQLINMVGFPLHVNETLL